MSTLGLVSFRVLIDGATSSMRRYFRGMLLPAAFPLAAAAALLGQAYVRWMRDLFGLGDDVNPALLLLLIGSVMAYLVVYGLAFHAVTAGAMQGVTERPVSMVNAWLFVLRPRAFLTLLVVGLVSGVGFMLCFFPGLYVFAALSFVVPVMLDEGRFGLRALHRSMELTHFNPSRSFWGLPVLQALAIVFIGWVVAYVLTMLVQTPFMIIQMFVTLRQASQGQEPDMAAMMEGQAWIQIPSAVVGSFATVIAWMYQTFALCVLFVEVRRRKEGQDLERAIEELTASTLRGPAAPDSAAGE